MALPNIFTKEVATGLVARINKLTPDTQPKWGKMSVEEMIAHCCVSYEMAYENKYPKPNAALKFILKLVAKNAVVNETPYKHSERTAPQFIIKGNRNFESEKKRLVDYINKTQQLGESYFDNKESHSFGKLNKTEWNNMFYKHLNHHLSQFGV